MNIQIPSDAIHHPQKLPSPKAVISRLPVVVRDRMAHVSMPAEYVDMCRAIKACETIDMAKYYADKAEALAAWAKIYKSDEAALAARQAKLEAFRKMGELAEAMAAEQIKAARELAAKEHAAKIRTFEQQREAARNAADKKRYARAQANLNNYRRATSKLPRGHAQAHPTRHLLSAGLTKAQATSALALKAMPESTFKKHVTAGASIRDARIAARGQGRTPVRFSEGYNWIMSGPGGLLLVNVLARMRERPNPGDLAAGCSPNEAEELRHKIREAIDWLDAFEQALPKS